MRRGTHRHRIAVGLVLVATALVTPAAVLARGHRPNRVAHRGLCPPHVKRRKGKCLTRPVRHPGTTPAAARRASSSAIAQGERALRRVPRSASGHVAVPLRHGLPPLLTNRGAAMAMTRVATLAASRAAGAGGSTAHAIRPRLGGAHAADAQLDGWNVNVNGSSSADENRVGSPDTQVTATATKDAIEDGLHVHGELTAREHRRLLVDICPQADGTVPGDGTEHYTFETAATVGKDRASVTVDINPTFTFLGHVDDSGRLRSFDMRMHLVVVAYGGIRGSDGRLYSDEPPHLYIVDASANDIDPDRPLQGGWNDDLSGRMDYHVFLGHTIWQDDVAPEVLKLADVFTQLDTGLAANTFKEAEQRWQGGDCVNVSLSTPSTTVSAGATFPVTATVTGLKQAAKHLADGKYTATASTGTINPPSGKYTSAPVQLTFAAPASGDPVVTVTAQSRQGKGVGTLDLHVGATYALRYTHSSQLDYDGPPEPVAAAPRPGTEDRHEQWALSTTIPLTGDPATGLSGTGPLGFTTAQYHLEWDGTFSGQASCNGTWTQDLTGTNAGNAQVSKLTFTSPANVRLTFDTGKDPGETGPLPIAPSENYHDVQTYDVCPGSTYDSTAYLWRDKFSNFYVRAGMGAAYGAAEIDSGWQPGTGNVLATRTVTGSFPWGGAPGTPTTSTWTDTYQILTTNSGG
jgi:hypothetical protein